MVDDSLVIRRAITNLLTEDPDIEVIGHAANGVIALTKIAELHPDVVTLDVEMPIMDGLETLRHLKKNGSNLPIIMCSTLTERGAMATLDALALGASCYVTKPHTSGSINESLDTLRRDLLPKVKALGGHHRTFHKKAAPSEAQPSTKALPASIAPKAAPSSTVPLTMPVGRPASKAPAPGALQAQAPKQKTIAAEERSSHSPAIRLQENVGRPIPASAYVPPPRTGPPARVDMVVIGVSTGGPNALATVLPALPKGLAVPILIVQHMPPVFTKLVAERLNAQCALEVCEATDGQPVTNGHIYIAPGDFHLHVERKGEKSFIRLSQSPPENFCRPAADVLFRSAVETYGSGILAVVLTGMGSDGMLGSEAIRKAGGQVIVQDAETSVVWGMPGSVADRGLADAILPIRDIAHDIVRRVNMQRKP